MKTGPVSRFLPTPAGAVLTILLVTCSVFISARADTYFELGYELGGDSLASTELRDLDAGGGYKLAIGVQKTIGGFDDVGLMFSIGYIYDWAFASRDDAEFYALVTEFLYFRDFGPHRLGVGGSYHVNPHYEDDVGGSRRTRYDFDNAFGAIGRYSYVIDNSVELGIRYTLIDYEASGDSFDANSLGFFIAGIF